jgi:ribonuclease H2 subunit A
MRDRMLTHWVSNVPDVSRLTGSGYPSDPKCKAWMEDLQDPLFGYCDLIRFSWAPTKTRLADKGRGVTFQADVDDEDEDDLQLQQGMTSFLGGGGKKRKRVGYFEKRKLRVVESV